MVRFHVLTLFITYPIVDSLEILSHHIVDVLELLKYVLTFTYFCFHDNFYEDGRTE
jgi:hypothetical protein